MGATLSEQRDSKCEEDEEPHSGQDEVQKDSAGNELLQKNGKLSSQNEKTESQTDDMNSQSDERDLVDVGSGFVTLREDASDMTDSIQDDVSDNMSKQMNNTDDLIVKEENEANNKVKDTEIGFKKIFTLGGFKLTLKKDKVEKIDTDEPIESEQEINAASPSEESWDTTDVNPVSTNEQDEEEIKKERIRVDANAKESPETQFNEPMEETTPEKVLMVDVPQCPKSEEPMSPVKRFFSQGILASLRKKKKEESGPKENENKLKSLNKMDEKETTKEDTTCTCLDVSSVKIVEDKDVQLYKKDESKHAAEGDIMNSLEQDKVQESPFRRLFRKLATRRQSETKPDDTNSLDPVENSSENPQLSTELFKSQNEQETKVDETQPVDEMMDMSPEESKKKSDSAVSWENLICVRSAKTRSRKTSDSEDETLDKGEVPRRTIESPFESSTEGDYLTSSNEQGASPAEDDSGSTWKSFKKLVTPKRRSRMEESGSFEQMLSDTDISKDESSCSLRKLISGRKKIKSDGQQEIISSDEGSKGTGTDIEDDETPGVVPLCEYEIAEPKMLKVTTDEIKRESKKEKEMQPIIEEDKPKQMQPLNNVKPLSFDSGLSDVPIPTEYMEELTEFLSKHQQLSDIPEEGIIEESVATPLSFIEWTTQYDTLADDIVDMTADAVTAPEHVSENVEDDTSEMVSAVSQLSESPKTSGNVTPISPVHHMRESDTIFQEVVESINMVPSILSITTQDKVPEAQGVSVSQFIVESTTTTETKVLVTHKKEEATSICIGIVCKEIRAAEVVSSLPLIEGISEITHVIPIEIVSGDLAEESKVAGITNDNVNEAEINEIKTILHEVLLLDEQSTILAETARKSKQQVIMVETVQEELSLMLQMEDVEHDSTKTLTGIHECTPVHTAVYSGSQLLEEQNILQNMNMPETEGPIHPALEEPVYEQLTKNTCIPFEVKNVHRIPDVVSLAADVEQFVQFTEVTKPVLHSVVSSESDPSLNQTSSITDAGVLVSDVKCLETTAPFSSVIPISDSIKIEMDLESEAQMKNDPSQHFVDSLTIQMNNTVLQTETKNAETVPVLSTATCSANGFKNLGIIEEVEKVKQKIEPTAEMIEEIGDENVIYNYEAENLSEIIDKPTEEKEGKESEWNTLVRESSLPVATTNEECSVKEPEDRSEVLLGLKKEHKEADTLPIEISKRKQAAGDEIDMLTLNPAETGEATKKPPAICEQTRVDEENPDYGVQLPATDKLITDEQTTAVAPYDSAKLEAVKRSCVDDEPDKLVASEQEYNETENPEITTELETVEFTSSPVETFPEDETRLAPDEPQREVLLSKQEKYQATESSHAPYEENNEAGEAMVRMTVSVSTFMYEEDTRVECTEQPAAILQCFNEMDQSVMSDIHLAEKLEGNETANPEVNAEIITEHQEGGETLKMSLKFEPRLNTEQPQKEFLFLKQEESQALESSHEPYDENNELIGAAEISKIISSVIYVEETGVECKISDQPVHAGQGVDKEAVRTMEHVSKILPKDEAESCVISETEGSEHVMEVIKATSEVSVEVATEHEVKMTVDFEENIVTPDATKKDVSEIDMENAADAEKNTELTTELKLNMETPTINSEGQTVLTSQQVAESPIVTENKNKPEVLTHEMNELEAETLKVAESKVDIIFVSETPGVASPVETPLVISTEKAVNIEALALPSVINKLQSDLKSVTETEISTGTKQHGIPTVVSEIQTLTGLSLEQTAALSPILKEVSEKEDVNINRPVMVEVTEPKLKMFMVTDTISHTSAVPAVVQTMEILALETDTLVRTCVEKDGEAQGSVVTSIKEDTDIDSLVLTSRVSKAQLKTLVELTAEDIPVSQKPTDGQLIQEPEMLMVAQKIKETIHETPDAVDVTALKKPEAQGQREEVTKQIIKETVLTSVEPEFESTSLKKDIVYETVPTLLEEPTAASFVKLPVTSEASVVETPTLDPAEVQRPTVVSVIETLPVTRAVKVEMQVTGPQVKERHSDAQAALNIEVKHLPLAEVNVTGLIEQVPEDVGNTANPKEDSKISEERSGRLKEISVPIIKIVESLPGVDDDIWEDANEDVRDDQCSSTKASDSLYDATMCHVND
ncbi:A-kinase anchor protein 12 [Tachysurus fulvidraco]|uniref:A-kinase anchor protein 12 n=1 Tax=Tachysurus fulvidraco TaxID=1234273 RepID=UPI001FEF8E1E|nr:A-kinase anchor protein 12 [Tachysurus fulvidraco]XP_047677673.1 A-kinase anchor protein 12 [Tachysurus fulvidraco]